MKKLLLVSLLATSALLPATSALAADLDVPPPPPPVEDLRPASYDWTGLYAGGWIGSICANGIATDNTTATDYEASGCGFKGGVLGGYNHQFENFVLGLEADWGMSNQFATNQEAGADFGINFDHLVTARARAGFAMDDTLFFVTGGGAWAYGDLNGIIAATPSHIHANHWGWTVGGGVEHALTDSFRVRMDYLYTQWSTENYTEACCNVDVNFGGEHEVRLGAVWAF
jgi:outer membrane immunogenic protein